MILAGKTWKFWWRTVTLRRQTHVCLVSDMEASLPYLTIVPPLSPQSTTKNLATISIRASCSHSRAVNPSTRWSLTQSKTSNSTRQPPNSWASVTSAAMAITRSSWRKRSRREWTSKILARQEAASSAKRSKLSRQSTDYFPSTVNRLFFVAYWLRLSNNYLN